MKVYDAASIRNVAIVGHSGSGKTQLAEAIAAGLKLKLRKHAATSALRRVNLGTAGVDIAEP